MKRIFLFILILTITATTFAGCSQRDYKLLVEGEHFKNPELSLEYVSFDTVRVTFSVEIYRFRGAVEVNVVLLGEGNVIGECVLIAGFEDEEKSHVVCSRDVKLSYYNGGSIKAYVNQLSATYF